MGHGFTKLSHCFSGPSSPPRTLLSPALISDAYDEGLGHSFCYVRPDTLSSSTILTPASSKVHHHALDETTTFRSISGASVSANPATALSTSLSELTWPAAASFESSTSFAAIPLQPGPRSGPLDRGFLSGPIERGFLSGPLDHAPNPLFSGPIPPAPLRRSLSHAPRPRRAAASLLRGLSKAISRTWNSKKVGSAGSSKPTSQQDEESFSISDDGNHLHWAQGKAGEDRVHVVISEDHGWVFVGIYDGFNGPDATDYLLSNLYSAVQSELKGLLWEDADQFDVQMNVEPHTNLLAKRWTWDRERVEMETSAVNHGEVMKALSRALSKTEEAYLDTADKVLAENPELALMGSCVLVMLMKGEDVYLLNVGDSRAVLGKKAEPEIWGSIGKAKQDLERINEEFDACDGGEDFPNLVALQLTVDHSTSIKEEVYRIREEHPDDALSIVNDRVKGSLKVTRAFGAGFLKQPKWNEALLEMFRIDYVGTSPYINCNPSLHHHKLGSKDRFLILSSDGLYQYFTNEEAVAEVELFIDTTPEGDPAQHLVEEVIFRAANKAGMDFHELLEIPQGDRRRYHDDVSIIVISLEGRIWRSCM